jgi:hypothetical protein
MRQIDEAERTLIVAVRRRGAPRDGYIIVSCRPKSALWETDFIDFGHCRIKPPAAEIRAVDVQNAVVANQQDWDFERASTPPMCRNLDETLRCRLGG